MQLSQKHRQNMARHRASSAARQERVEKTSAHALVASRRHADRQGTARGRRCTSDMESSHTHTCAHIRSRRRSTFSSSFLRRSLSLLTEMISYSCLVSVSFICLPKSSVVTNWTIYASNAVRSTSCTDVIIFSACDSLIPALMKRRSSASVSISTPPANPLPLVGVWPTLTSAVRPGRVTAFAWVLTIAGPSCADGDICCCCCCCSISSRALEYGLYTCILFRPGYAAAQDEDEAAAALDIIRASCMATFCFCIAAPAVIAAIILSPILAALIIIFATSINYLHRCPLHRCRLRETHTLTHARAKTPASVSEYQTRATRYALQLSSQNAHATTTATQTLTLFEGTIERRARETHTHTQRERQRGTRATPRETPPVVSLSLSISTFSRPLK